MYLGYWLYWLFEVNSFYHLLKQITKLMGLKSLPEITQICEKNVIIEQILVVCSGIKVCCEKHANLLGGGGSTLPQFSTLNFCVQPSEICYFCREKPVVPSYVSNWRRHNHLRSFYWFFSPLIDSASRNRNVLLVKLITEIISCVTGKLLAVAWV